jgi:hypothetical protein
MAVYSELVTILKASYGSSEFSNFNLEIFKNNIPYHKNNESSIFNMELVLQCILK